jgi:hypothetical protein
MTPERFGVWSPHRDSNSVRAFKAALSLRSEPWQWHEDMKRASWWVIDGTQTTLDSLTSDLQTQKKNGVIHTVVLAPSWNHIEDPVWVFFKVPLNIKLVYGWIDRSLLQRLPPSPLAGQQLRLKRWPNLTRYNANCAPADSMHLTIACARLLEHWASYEEMLAIAKNPLLFDRMLADARQEGILDTSAPAPVSEHSPASGTPETKTPEKTNAWSLVKRLLSKFT